MGAFPDGNRRLPFEDKKTLRDPYTCDIVFLDVETTGLTPEWHEIISVGIIRARQPGLEIVSRFEAKISPVHLERAQADALAVNGYNAQAWAQAIPLSKAMLEVYRLVQDVALCAHKSGFDEAFVYHALKKCAYLRPDQEAPWFYVFDTMSNAQLLFRGVIPRLRGELLAEGLGLAPESKPHRALSGAMQCYEIYRRQRQIADDPFVAQRIRELVTSFHTT